MLQLIPENNWELTEDAVNCLQNIFSQLSLTSSSVTPKREDILRFLNVDINSIKYVIVGLDPYPSFYKSDNVLYPEATGRSFEVASLDSWLQPFKQASLRNILKGIYYSYYKELLDFQTIRKKITDNSFPINKNPHVWFYNLEKQGVLWLNLALTTDISKPAGAHIELWRPFMEVIIKKLKKKHVKWILWGSKAQDSIISIVGAENCICAVHPRIHSFATSFDFKQINVDWFGNQ